MRFAAAQPWFSSGAVVSLANAKRYVADSGKLALVQVGGRGVGRVVEILGLPSNIHVLMRGLLAEEGLLGEGDLGAEVRTQLEGLPPQVPLLDQREDLRSDLVVTIDPPNAKDHDDAIGIIPAQEHENHAWTIWIHIADVSAYVKTGSAIDQQALERAMSAYVPGAVAPMLPHELSSDLCSLRPGVDRGCVSVAAKIDAEGKVVDVRFARTLIRSSRKLSYDQVDRVLDGQASIDPIIDRLLHGLDQVTRLLRHNRMNRGALDMALPDVEFELGETEVTQARLAQPSPSHRLVEECMLVANDAVGQRLEQDSAPGIWRVHDHPDPSSIDALLKAFDSLGVPVPKVPEQYSGAEAAAWAVEIVKRSQHYAEVARRGRISFAPRVLRALQQAEYRSHAGPHSGLATHSYAHFTSPIRRYPDLVNHRSLLHQLGLGDSQACIEPLSEVARYVSARERDLQKLERRAEKIALASVLYRWMHVDHSLGDHGSDGRFRGEVNGLISAGLFVRFGEVFEGFLPIRSISNNERYQLDELGLAIVGSRSGHRIRLGDAIDVYVDRVDRATGKIDLRVDRKVHEDASGQARERRTKPSKSSKRRNTPRRHRRR